MVRNKALILFADVCFASCFFLLLSFNWNVKQKLQFTKWDPKKNATYCVRKSVYSNARQYWNRCAQQKHTHTNDVPKEEYKGGKKCVLFPQHLRSANQHCHNSCEKHQFYECERFSVLYFRSCNYLIAFGHSTCFGAKQMSTKPTEYASIVQWFCCCCVRFFLHLFFSFLHNFLRYRCDSKQLLTLNSRASVDSAIEI